jgi:hypothetical protein
MLTDMNTCMNAGQAEYLDSKPRRSITLAKENTTNCSSINCVARLHLRWFTLNAKETIIPSMYLLYTLKIFAILCIYTWNRTILRTPPRDSQFAHVHLSKNIAPLYTVI